MVTRNSHSTIRTEQAELGIDYRFPFFAASLISLCTLCAASALASLLSV